MATLLWLALLIQMFGSGALLCVEKQQESYRFIQMSVHTCGIQHWCASDLNPSWLLSKAGKAETMQVSQKKQATQLRQAILLLSILTVHLYAFSSFGFVHEHQIRFGDYVTTPLRSHTQHFTDIISTTAWTELPKH